MDSIKKILIEGLIVILAFGMLLLGINSWKDSQVKAALSKQEYIFKQELLDIQKRNNIKLNVITSSLQEKNLKLQEAKQNEIKVLDSTVADLRRRLQERPERPFDTQSNLHDSSGKDSTQQGCTGTGLYRNDGLFLTGYAQRAAEVQIEYNFCVDKYNGLVDALEELKKENK